jgi:secondary thiamine-phosphate synthase enzyme
MLTESTTRARSCYLQDEHHLYTRETHSLAVKEWSIVSETITINTPEAPHFIDLTEIVQDVIVRESIVIGTALIFSKHTTAAVVVNEHEPLLLEDISDLLERLVPHTMTANYRHDDMDIRTVNLVENEPLNGHAHCQHLFLGASLQIPIKAGRLDLGQWQRVFLVELDRPRPRQVVIQLTGVQG